MGLTERKQINNGSWLQKNLHLPEEGEGWGNAITGAAGFLSAGVNSFSPAKTSTSMLSDAGQSTGYGPGFTYVKQNSPNYGKELAELSRQNTQNTLNTATAGATAGAAFGPIGAGIGFLAGGITGLIGGGARKRDFMEQMKQAKLDLNAFNDYSLASGQSDFLTTDYNTKYDNSQNDLIYHAENGKMPKTKLRKGLEPNAMVSNGEIIGHVDDYGNVIDAMRVGHGKDNKDTVPVHLEGGKEPSDNSFVITNKGGISDYVAATGDVKGGLQIQKQMKEYQRYKQLWNGKIPMFAGGNMPKLPWFVADENPKPGELGPATSGTGLTPQHPNEWKDYQDKIVGQLSDYRDLTAYTGSENVDAGSKRSSWVIPAALSALGVATANSMRPTGEGTAEPTFVDNGRAQQALDMATSRRVNTNAQQSALRDAEARARYDSRTRGTSIGSYALQAAANHINTMKQIAQANALGQDAFNKLMGENAQMAASLGEHKASRMQQSNQNWREMLHRAKSLKYTLDNNAKAQMLGQMQYGYKSIFDLNKWLDTMGLYDRDYALRRDELRRRV